MPFIKTYAVVDIGGGIGMQQGNSRSRQLNDFNLFIYLQNLIYSQPSNLSTFHPYPGFRSTLLLVSGRWGTHQDFDILCAEWVLCIGNETEPMTPTVKLKFLKVVFTVGGRGVSLNYLD